MVPTQGWLGLMSAAGLVSLSVFFVPLPFIDSDWLGSHSSTLNIRSRIPRLLRQTGLRSPRLVPYRKNRLLSLRASDQSLSDALGSNSVSLPKNFTREDMLEYPYRVLAFYAIRKIAAVDDEVEIQRDFLAQRGMVGRVYVSSDGINAQISGTTQDIENYMKWIGQRFGETRILFKLDPSPELAFPRLRCKSKQLVPKVKGWEKEELDVVDQRGEDVSPEVWKEMLSKRNQTGAVVLDVRNNYEWDLGHFEGTERPKYREFKEFEPSAFGLDNAEKIDKSETPIMMYCTGGIRCEVYSAMLKKQGFKKVYKLQGGIQHYGNTVGDDLWKGKLFVFDRRNAVSLGNKSPVVGKCYHCEEESEIFRNCCNVDCNRLHLCCDRCWNANKGCCCEKCSQSERVHPYDIVVGERKEQFDRWHNYRDLDDNVPPIVTMSLMQGPPPGSPDINRPAHLKNFLESQMVLTEQVQIPRPQKGEIVMVKLPNSKLERAVVKNPKVSGKMYGGKVKVQYLSDNTTFHVHIDQIIREEEIPEDPKDTPRRIEVDIL